MTAYQPGDLVLVAFPYAGDAQYKNRPALVILDVGDADIAVARVTTQPYQTPFDFTITGWQKAGLLAPSVVRLHKLASPRQFTTGRPGIGLCHDATDLRIVGDGLICQFNFLPCQFRSARGERSPGPVSLPR